MAFSSNSPLYRKLWMLLAVVLCAAIFVYAMMIHYVIAKDENVHFLSHVQTEQISNSKLMITARWNASDHKLMTELLQDPVKQATLTNDPHPKAHIYGTEMEISDILFINNDTKIVEIGLPKTGTTSLQAALRTLGYKTVGWNAKWWTYYLETYDLNRILLEAKKSSAFTDSPWHTLHYRFWMKAYPNSRFIYQYRDEEAWLHSLESHFSPKYDVNHIGEYLDERWITNRSYIREWWIEEHRQRMEDVMTYFKDKPSKLLVMDITNGMQWKPLCDFLKKPVPSKAFPEANKSHRKKKQH